MPRYAVTLNVEMNITADDEAEAIRNCNSDTRELLAENTDLEVADIDETDEDLTEDVDDIEFEDAEVVEAAERGSSDWIMNGVYVVVVEAPDRNGAIEAAKTLAQRLIAEESPAPSI